MVSEVFADTSGWASFFVRTEKFHLMAKSLMSTWCASGVRLVTTNYVLTELVALLASPLRVARTDQIVVIETIRAAAWVEVVHVDSAMHEDAWTLLKGRMDKTWSWVDCASFVVMGRRGIGEAFATDHHFDQAGFARLLR